MFKVYGMMAWYTHIMKIIKVGLVNIHHLM